MSRPAFRKPKRRGSPNLRSLRRTLNIEQLDRREMMAGNVLGRVDISPKVTPEQVINSQSGIHYDATTRSVVIRGTTEGDFAMVLSANGGTRIDVSLTRGTTSSTTFQSFDLFRWQMIPTGGGASVQVPVEPLVNRIQFIGEAGDDQFYNFSGVPTDADGGDGKDTLTGGSGTDKLVGGNDEDTLVGNGGDDFLDGQGERDLLNGGTGRDELWGGNDLDTLIGGDGVDALHGGAGGDTLDGGDGDDYLYGEGGNDTLQGGRGRDILYGDEDNDTLDGGDETDLLYGGAGHDRLFGGNGDDSLWGNSGMDVLRGGAGADRVFGGGEYDFLDPGNDPGDKSYSGMSIPGAGYRFNGSLDAKAIQNISPLGMISQEDIIDTLAPLDVNAKWIQARSSAMAQVRASLEGREVKPGFALYDTSVFLAYVGEATIIDDAGNISLRFTLRGNSATGSVSQPTFLGSWADPRFTMRFDLEITVPLAEHNRLVAGTPSVRMLNNQVTSNNLVSTMVLPLIQLFTGNVSREVEAKFNRPDGNSQNFGALLKNEVATVHNTVNAILAEKTAYWNRRGVNFKQELEIRVMYDATQGKLVGIVDVLI